MTRGKGEYLSRYVFSRVASLNERWAHIGQMAQFVADLISRKRMGNPCSVADAARARLVIGALPENKYKHCAWCIREEKQIWRFALAGLAICGSHAHDALDQKVTMT